jgi:acetyltransferase-like isoleucine patch superfamily enzyme
MIKYLINKFVPLIISSLNSNKEFISIIKATCSDYYIYESLKHSRVWGDPSRVKMGKDVQINNALFNTVSGNIEIGDYTFFGHSVSILTGTHDCTKFNLERQISVPNEGRNVIIGKSVWIASNATIIGPCRIGDYATIGVGSVVIGDVEASSFYAGVPAKFVKKL